MKTISEKHLQRLRNKIFELHMGTRPKAKDVMKAVDEYVEAVKRKVNQKNNDIESTDNED